MNRQEINKKRLEELENQKAQIEENLKQVQDEISKMEEDKDNQQEKTSKLLGEEKLNEDEMKTLVECIKKTMTLSHNILGEDYIEINPIKEFGMTVDEIPDEVIQKLDNLLKEANCELLIKNGLILIHYLPKKVEKDSSEDTENDDFLNKINTLMSIASKKSIQDDVKKALEKQEREEESIIKKNQMKQDLQNKIFVAKNQIQDGAKKIKEKTTEKLDSMFDDKDKEIISNLKQNLKDLGANFKNKKGK